MQLLRLLVVCACALSAAAHAQLRAIPEQAKGGDIQHVHDMIVAIDGVQLRLAPGAQIRDESNRLVLPTAVPVGAKVKYLLNAEGQVRQVWILSPAEASKREASD